RTSQVVRSLSFTGCGCAVRIDLWIEQCEDILSIGLIEKNYITSGGNFRRAPGDDGKNVNLLTSVRQLSQHLRAGDGVQLLIEPVNLHSLLDQRADHLGNVLIAALTCSDEVRDSSRLFAPLRIRIRRFRRNSDSAKFIKVSQVVRAIIRGQR